MAKNETIDPKLLAHHAPQTALDPWHCHNCKELGKDRSKDRSTVATAATVEHPNMTNYISKMNLLLG